MFSLEVPDQEREIEISDFGYSETPNEMYGRYNTDSSTFEFDPPVFQSEYGGYVNGTLSTGPYRLDVVDINGVSHSETYDFKGLLDIPIIQSTSFRAKKDNEELEFRWDLPDEWFNSATRTYAILNAYADGTYVGQLYVRVPSYIEFLSIPTSVVEQIKTWGNRFTFAVQFRTSDGNNRTYSREVAVDLDNALIAHFADVPFDYWSYENIEKLLESGITTGCGDGNYCPGDTVTRAQMAVFLERGIQGSDFAPPSASGVFADVPLDYWAADWIEQFFADGITKGCDTEPLSYCPEQEVTRAEMAIFLLRAKYGSSYSPPKATGIFSDVSTDYWAADWIEQLYAEGITTGCGESPLRFCPDDSVTRDQMAAFLVRTFGL